MAVDVSAGEFNSALWKRFKAGKIRNVYPLAKYNDIVEKIKTMERNPPCNTPGEYYLLRKFVVANIDGRERLCCKPDNCSVSEKTVDSARCDLKFYVALEEIYNCIDEVHRSMIHGGKDRIVRSIQKKGVVNITRETVELYLSFCKVCRPLKKEIARKTKVVTIPSVNNRICDSPINNISSESEGAERFCLMNNITISDTIEVPPTESRSSEAYFSLNRSYIDLIDFSSAPDGDYRFVFLYLDLQTNFCVLHPVRCKCTYEIASHLLNVFTLLGPPQVLHSNFEESFILQIIGEIKQTWSDLVIVSGTSSYLEIQEVAGNCVSELHSLLKSWLSENNSKRWSAALKFIQLRRNTALVNGSKSPYECLFGKSMHSKILPQIDISLLTTVNKEDELMNLINSQSEMQQYESLQIALDPNICNFVQNHSPQDSHGEESEHIIESSVIKAEPLSESENLTNGIYLSESSNDASCSPNFGNLEIVIKQEKDDS